MRAESRVDDSAAAGPAAAPKGFLSAIVAVARSARPGTYVVVHFGSGTFFRTDWLGALAIRALIDGQSDAEAIELVEGIEGGSGVRARWLIDKLGSKGALTHAPGWQAGRRGQLRRMSARVLGLAMSIGVPLLRLTPTRVLALMFRILPPTPTAHHVWRSNRLTILNYRRANGSAAPRRPNPQRNFLFMYMSTVLTPDSLGRLVDSLFDRRSVDDLADRLQATGPTVGVFLHSPLCVAVPNVLRARGQDVVRVVIPRTNGINVSERSGPLRDFFGESAEMAVEMSDPLAAIASASGSLLRHLKAGRSVYVALDVPVRDRRPGAEIEMLGQSFSRNDWPAWLAVRSGRPLALWSTYGSSSGVVITASPFLYPDPSLRIEHRVAALSAWLYAQAEAAIREHPEAWTFMGHLSLLTVDG